MQKINTASQNSIYLESLNYINPTEPAVNPTAKKKVNSNKSLGRELTNNFS